MPKKKKLRRPLKPRKVTNRKLKIIKWKLNRNKKRKSILRPLRVRVESVWLERGS